jgi:hypothetical protein
MRFMVVVFIMLALAGTASASTTTYNWSFTPPIINNESWTFYYVQNYCSNPGPCAINAGNNTTDGIPAGSLFINMTVQTTGSGNKEGNYTTSWRSPNFSWNNGTPASANLSFSLINASSQGSTVSGTFDVTLIKPVGSALIFPTTAIDSSNAWLNFSNSSVSPSDFSGSGNYSILLNATLDVFKPSGKNSIGFLEIHWDNPIITLVTLPPNITSWGNNKTNDQSTNLTLNDSEAVRFNATANQTITTWNWFEDGVSQSNNFDNISTSFSGGGTHTLTVTSANANGISNTVTWTINVPEIIDVTLSNVPVNFGNVSAGSSNQPALLPLIATIQNTTNVNVNLTLNGSSFTYGAYSFGVENMTYSNSSTGTQTSMTSSFPLPPYADWINITKLVTTNRSIYLWISIPPGQSAGAYSSTITVLVEKYS